MAIDKSVTNVGGGDLARWDHRAPALTGPAANLVPAAVGNALERSPVITKLNVPLRTHEMETKMRAAGAQVETVAFPVYRMSKDGAPRKLDNTDMVRGYTPLYSGVDHLLSTTRQVSSAINQLRDLFERNDGKYPGLLSMEIQDLDKITMQRAKYPGWFLQYPFQLDIKRTPYSVNFIIAIKAILARYAKEVSHLLKQPWSALLMEDYDPPETMVGLPTMASGDLTHPARIFTLKAIVPPTDNPISWLTSLSSIGEKLGLPKGFTYSSMQSTRYGPTTKEIPLWTLTDSGYTATYAAQGMLPRVRLVYPTCYPVNFALSPTYITWSQARMKILGLWHTPELRNDYVRALQQQGKHVYTCDFSGMDTSMPPHLIQLICKEAIAVGFHEWPLRMLSSAYTTMGVVSPPWTGQWGLECTWIRKMFPWMSGFKLTSEMDTIFGAATLLTCLEEQIPGSIQKWVDSKFIFGELGDDIIFTLSKELDMDKFSKDAKSLCGADVKILPNDALFLKTMLPLVPAITKVTKPISRLIQQTFFNEDNYEGKGGIAPDALLRLGLMARAEFFNSHPLARDILPIILPPLMSLGFIERSSSDYKGAIRRGEFSLDKGDEEQIQLYATRNPFYIDELIDRAKYISSAADTLRLLAEAGISTTMSRDALAMRKLYVNAFQAQPQMSDVRKVHSMMTWMR